MPFDKILFPVDFSEQCAAVAEYVAAITRDHRAKLTLLHVLECPPPWYGDLDAMREPSAAGWEAERERLQEQLNRYLETPFRDLAPLRVTALGDPAAEIVQYAEREQVSLIMMPTHGRGVFRQLLLGSVTAKVLHDTSVPVWTSSHTETVIPARYPCRVVACAVDLSPRSVEALLWARRFASEQNAAMVAVHALAVEEESVNRGVCEVRRYLRERALDQWRQMEKEIGLLPPLRIAYGSPGEGLRKAAHDLQADIVIIGRGHLAEPLGRLRTNAYAIIRESRCPVISV